MAVGRGGIFRTSCISSIVGRDGPIWDGHVVVALVGNWARRNSRVIATLGGDRTGRGGRIVLGDTVRDGWISGVIITICGSRGRDRRVVAIVMNRTIWNSGVRSVGRGDRTIGDGRVRSMVMRDGHLVTSVSRSMAIGKG